MDKVNILWFLVCKKNKQTSSSGFTIGPVNVTYVSVIMNVVIPDLMS